MQVHQRGLDLMMNVQDAIDYVDILSKEDTLRLLREVNIVLSQLLEQDIPASGVPDGQPEVYAWKKQ
ncbi:hypothetical protein ABMA46_10280 [Mesorhizobium sp. CN5-321]|uniref:hypothetical protein n=1 Tax=Mesorhizobium hunchu TaxID=3157708 RepID=UPI0032B7491C